MQIERERQRELGSRSSTGVKRVHAGFPRPQDIVSGTQPLCVTLLLSTLFSASQPEALGTTPGFVRCRKTHLLPRPPDLSPQLSQDTGKAWLDLANSTCPLGCVLQALAAPPPLGAGLEATLTHAHTTRRLVEMDIQTLPTTCPWLCQAVGGRKKDKKKRGVDRGPAITNPCVSPATLAGSWPAAP